MPQSTPETLRQQIASRRTVELYLIHGSDEGEKAALAAAFTDVVEPELRAFNVERLYGSDGDLGPGDIASAARTMPMMGDRRVIVVLQAERVLQPKRESDAANDALEVLAQYLQSPSPSTVLVFVTGDELNRQRRIARMLFKSATTVECGALGSSGEGARIVKGPLPRAARPRRHRRAVPDGPRHEVVGGGPAGPRRAPDRGVVRVGRYADWALPPPIRRTSRDL